MLKKHLVGAMAAASLLVVPVNQAQANDFVGGLVGGLIGGAVGSGLAN